MQTEIIGEQIVQGFLAGIIGGVFKNFRAEILGEANDFKKMAVAIAGKRRDAHASENFSQTGVYGAASFLDAAPFERFRKFIREVGQDGAGASSHQQRDRKGQHCNKIASSHRFLSSRFQLLLSSSSNSTATNIPAFEAITPLSNV